MNKCKDCGKEYEKYELCEESEKGFCRPCVRERNIIVSCRERHPEFRQKTFTPRLIEDLEQNFEMPIDIPNLLQTFQKEKGGGLYIHGLIGSGKTVLAATVLDAYKYDCCLRRVAFSSFFLTVGKLLEELRNTFNSQEFTERQVIKKYSNIEWLVLDDIGGGEKITDWTMQSLTLIIDHRYEYLKPTIFTSNLNLNQLAKRLRDDRIPSRINKMCYIYHLGGKDKRLEAREPFLQKKF